MNVILLEKVPNLGDLGDVISVKAGYARNYLIPKGKAKPATKENLADFEARRAELEKQAAEAKAAAEATYEKMNGIVVTISAQAGEEGKLFGSVGTQDIADALVAADFAVQRRDIRLPEGVLRHIGTYEIAVQLHSDVVADITVDVTPEDAK